MAAAFVRRKRERQREAYASWLQRSRRSRQCSRRSCLVSLPHLRCERGACAHVGHVLCLSRHPVLARAATGVKDEAQRARSSQPSRGRRPGLRSPRALRVGGLREARRGSEGPRRVASPTASIWLWRHECREWPRRWAGWPARRPNGLNISQVSLYIPYPLRVCAGSAIRRFRGAREIVSFLEELCVQRVCSQCERA